jgi:galactonate dehydratase
VRGLTEATRIAALAEAAGVSVAAHDCTGPVVLAASVHLAVCHPNVPLQEFVRAFYNTWYADLVTDLPPIEHGYIYPLGGPGLGTRLQQGTRARSDARWRTTP